MYENIFYTNLKFREMGKFHPLELLPPDYMCSECNIYTAFSLDPLLTFRKFRFHVDHDDQMIYYIFETNQIFSLVKISNCNTVFFLRKFENWRGR